MMTKSNHSFHLVDQSPWPLFGSLGALVLTSGMVKWFHSTNMDLFYIGILLMLMTSYQWWRDISREGTYQGLHTYVVFSGLKLGMVLFIVSEIFFFLSFFWGFFHSSLAPTMEIGLNWPPSGVESFNPFQIPLLNTVILLSSGITVTWAHHSIIESNYSQSIYSLLLTILLGIYFTMLQGLEYSEASFCISDSIYGASFFMATGFHGLHVLIGTMFLLVCLLRMSNCHFSDLHHFGFEAAAWYWHFVDVVWLFLYMNLYWWGS